MEINKTEAVIFTVEELKEKKKRVEKKKNLGISNNLRGNNSWYFRVPGHPVYKNPYKSLLVSLPFRNNGPLDGTHLRLLLELGKRKKNISFQGNAAPRFPLINKRHKAVREERRDRVAWSDEINTSKKKKRKKF